MGLAVVARIYPHDHARTPSHREIIVHASLSEDEGVVSNRLGPGLTTRFTKAARREYRFSRITPFRIAQVPVGQQHAGRNGLALLCDTGRYKIRIGRCGALEDLAGGTGGG
jgi:hypothetical protein